MPIDKPRPCPVAYCAVEHGGTLFPDLLLRLLGAGGAGPDPYALLAVVKKQVCTGCAATAIRCDPEVCRAKFGAGLAKALATDHPVPSFATYVRAQYSAYYDADVLGLNQRARPSPAIAALLGDDLADLFKG